MLRLAILFGVFLVSVVADDCYITADGYQGTCAGDLDTVTIIGSDCEYGSAPVSIDSSYLQVVTAITSINTFTVCGVSFGEDSEVFYNIKSFNDLTYSNNEGMNSIEFGNCTSANSIVIQHNPNLESIFLNSMSVIYGSIAVIYNDNLTSVAVPMLHTLGMSNGTAYVNDGVSYSLFARHNSKLQFLCDVDPFNIAYGIFICDNSEWVQVRDYLIDNSPSQTLCNVSKLPMDASCPCHDVFEPKNCKSGPGPGPKKGKKGGISSESVGAATGGVIALALGVFGGYALMQWRNKRLQRRNGIISDYEMASSNERSPLLSAGAGVAPPAYQETAGEKPPEYTDLGPSKDDVRL